MNPKGDDGERGNLELLFKSLIDLIKHTDDQVTHYAQFHLVALGALVPVLGYLITRDPPASALVGIIVLAVALALNWTVSTTKVTLQKLCWVKQVREVEERLFGQVQSGPFVTQEAFFKSLDARGVTARDRIILHQVATRQLRAIPMVVLVTGILIMASFGLLPLLSTARAATPNTPSQKPPVVNAPNGPVKAPR